MLPGIPYMVLDSRNALMGCVYDDRLAVCDAVVRQLGRIFEILFNYGIFGSALYTCILWTETVEIHELKIPLYRNQSAQLKANSIAWTVLSMWLQTRVLKVDIIVEYVLPKL